MNKLIVLTTLLAINMSQAKNSITVYSGNHQGHLSQNQLQNIHNISGFAVVKQTREAQFKKGVFELAFDDVAEHIDPTTVSFKLSKEADRVTVLDQNFQFDLVSTDKLLQKYLDQDIKVSHDLGDNNIITEGTLLSTTGGLTLKTQNGQITTIKEWNKIDFPDLPGGLLTKPTLVWLLKSTTSGEENIDLAYQTKGMTWWSDYIINLNESDKDCMLDIMSWVTIVNKSGAGYQETQLKLIAGDVNRATSNPPRTMTMERMAKVADSEFTEQSLHEYHLYKLPRKVDIPNNSTKQIQLLQNTHNIACKKTLRFNGSGYLGMNYHRPITDRNYLSHAGAKIESFLIFKNDKENQLGLPLPAGRVRVNTIDPTDHSLEFIGEDSIDHTPKNKTITLKLGNSFDVTGERKQSQFQLLKNSIIEQFEITISNQKTATQQVEVIEPLYRWSNWQITQHNEEYEQLDAATIKFMVDVAAESTKTLKYTVQYHWPETK
ncbi:MAG: DUF4139 domain-containing protein [Xanthomonadales bacterium]|nr:DUF4139 domain-containing protein [Xanthomonadales bacterium]